MHKVIMRTAKPAFTGDDTGILVRILESTYAKADLKQVSNNTTHLNAKERTKLIRLLGDFKDLFYGTLGNWDIDTVKLELNPGYIPFNSKYYLFPRINKETFCKELKRLVKIGLLTPVQHSQYGTPVYIHL